MQTPITKPQTVKKSETTALSQKERIQKADELKSLTLKRARTIKTMHDIRMFSFASDDNYTLTINDSEHQEFETSSSNLISLLKEYVIKVLGDKVSELDDEILTFQSFALEYQFPCANLVQMKKGFKP